MTAKRHFTLFLLALLFAVGCLAKNAVALMAAGNVFVKLGDADAANSLTGEYNANEVKRHTTTFDNISRYSVITDRSQIEIVAVLFNTQTGRIENAAAVMCAKEAAAHRASGSQRNWQSPNVQGSMTCRDAR